MATYATLTVNAADIIGADFDKSRASVWVEANTEHGLVVVDGTSIRVGGRRENLVDGVATFQLVTTNSADNPTSFGYRVTIVYVPKGSRKQGHDTLTTSDFSFTASANLAAIDEAWDNITLPPSWRSDFRDEMEALRDEAQGFVDQQESLAAIDDTDTAVAYAMEFGAETPGYLAATFATLDSEGRQPVRKGELVINVMDYGAAGNGITDDTAAIQACFNAAPEHATIYFPGKHRVSTITLNTRYITLTGPGTIYEGKLRIGTTGTRQDMFWAVDGLTFEGTTRASGQHGIELLKTRRGTIRNCVFVNLDKAVHVAPLAGAAVHDTAQVKVIDNEFISVNYALYVDRDDAASWMVTSDWKFLANTVNVAYIQHIWIKSIDGIVISDNVFFFPSYNANATDRANKKQNIYIGQSDWIHIKGNNLFESGEEAIHLDMAKHFVVANNQFAWPGQKAPYPAIKLTGTNTPNGLIADNVLSRFTGNAIDVLTTGGGTIVVKDNIMEYDATTNTYYGTPALNTFTHYGLNVDAASTDTVIESGNETTGGIYHNRKGSNLTTMKLSNESGLSYAKAQVAVTAANTPIFTVTSSRSGTNTFSGLVFIEAKFQDTESTNLSSWVFHVSKHPLGTSITKISEQGVLAGGSANHTSFTFTMDATGRILATPVGSTSGTFFFYGTHLGNIRLAKAP